MSNPVDDRAEEMEEESRRILSANLPPEAVDDAVCKAGWFKASLLESQLRIERDLNKAKEYEKGVRW